VERQLRGEASNNQSNVQRERGKEMNQHWTANSTADFVHRITSDFVAQLLTKIEEEPIERQELAARLQVTPGRVSQVLNNPGNMTVGRIVEYTRALGMKVAIVAYDDADPENTRGPISSEVFNRAWQSLGKPHDLFSLAEPMLLSPHYYSEAEGQLPYALRTLQPLMTLSNVKTQIADQQLQSKGGKLISQEKYYECA
jgi:hypothetical protein